MGSRVPVRGRGSNQHQDKPPEVTRDQTAVGGIHRAPTAEAAAVTDPLADSSPPSDNERLDADRSRS